MVSVKRQLKPTSFKGQALNKSKGIFDDYAVRKNLATREGTVEKVPVNDSDIANKKYVDDTAGGGGAPEGTAVLSTGEGGATQFLREDGDGTCSWQTPAGGDVSATANLTDETLVQGDGGAKGVKTSTETIAHITTAYDHSQDNTQAHSDYLLNTGDTGTGDYIFSMTDDTADSFTIQQGANHYMCCDTVNGSEKVVFGCGAVPTILTVEAALISTEVNLDVDGDIVVSGTVDGVDIATRDHAESHDIASHSDTAVTGAELTASEAITSGGTNALFKQGDDTYTDNDTAQTFTDAFCTATSLVIVSITDASDPQGTWSVESATGEFTITSTVAETDDIDFDYYIIKN